MRFDDDRPLPLSVPAIVENKVADLSDLNKNMNYLSSELRKIFDISTYSIDRGFQSSELN